MVESDTKKSEAADELLGQLTGDQKKLLSQAIGRVTKHVLSDATKRLRNYLLVAAAIVTLFAAVSLVGLTTAIRTQLSEHCARILNCGKPSRMTLPQR